MLTTGKVIRFDEVRGYGFIAPTEPGEDVFMHANDLVDEEYLYHEGSDVEFFMEQGDKGPKASQIRLRAQRSASRPAGSPVATDDMDAEPYRQRTGRDSQDAAQFRRDLTDALIESVDTLTAAQIKQVRECVLKVARNAGHIAK